MTRPIPETSDYVCDVTECPFCGSSEGFSYRWADVSTTYYTWDGVAIGTSEPTPIFTRKMRCISCAKIVENHVKPREILGMLRVTT